MSSFVTGKLPAAKAGWLLALVFVGWLAFLFVPGPKPEPLLAPAFVKPPPSRLVELGLPDNPDLEHLPEFFALYADQAEWKDDKTIFAYWNPGSKRYSYFFEATRTNGSYRFMTIAEPHNERYSFDGDMPEDGPVRLYKYDPEVTSAIIHNGKFLMQMPRPKPDPIKSDIRVDRIKPPAPEIKIAPPDLEQKK